MRLLREVAGLTLSLWCAAAAMAGQTPRVQTPPAATDVTVRVFTTQVVTSLTLAPVAGGATIRTCPACSPKPMTAPVEVAIVRGAMRVSDGPAMARLQLSGSLLLTSSSASAPAAADRISGGRSVASAGEWTIAPVHGELRILLTLPSERYVAAAVSGESAPNEPLESLKAMAVVTRTFALANLHRHAAEGFGLCDSTHCQALRLGLPGAAGTSAPASPVEQAVRETAGETLWYGPDKTGRSGAARAQVFFAQNCGGGTEDVASVWPDIHAPYLNAHPDPYCLRRDQALWHADIPLAVLARIFKGEGWTTPARIDAVHVIKRTSSGRAQLIEVSGGLMRSTVSASSMRFAVNRTLGWNTMRSDNYETTVAPGGTAAGPLELGGSVLHLEGRGFGHGVGLCQAGATEMATEHQRYRDILAFYFAGTWIGLGATDSGWTTTPNATTGWVLRSVDSGAALKQAGDAAWVRARQLFPPHGPSPKPTVSAAPTTEIFRQMTWQPGWLLAVTRGDQVVLQPAGVLGGKAGPTLLHEFLHVLVEQEASPSAPLWLREGLVEALADPSRIRAGATPTPAQIDAALAHPADAEASRQAHEAAAGLVTRLIGRYGTGTVRSWLRGQVPAQALQL